MSRPSLGLPAATALVVGNMVGVGVLLAPRLVAQAVPSLAAMLGLWLLGGVVAAAGAAVYAELGSRFPEAGGDVVFQEAGLGRAVALGSGVLMFVAAFAASIAAISVAIGTWQVPALLGLPQPAEGALPSVVGLGVIGLLTGANLLGLRVGAGVQLLSTALPLVALTLLAGWTLVSGAGGGPPAPPAELNPYSLTTAFSAVYFAYAGWPAVVYLAGEVRDPSRVLPRAMLGGTALVTALYLLLNLAFARALGVGGLQGTPEAGSALVQAVIGEEAGWLMAAVVLLALLASVNATIMGGARVAVALARRGGLPAALGQHSKGGVPAAALVVQAVVAGLIVLSGTFEEIVEGSVLAMLAIGSLTVLSLVVLRRREGRGSKPLHAGYRAGAWPLPAAVYLLVSGSVLGSGVLALLIGPPGEEGAVLSLVLLGLCVAFFRGRLRRRPRP